MRRNVQRSPTIARPGRLAQLARAPPLQGGGHWFESSNAHPNRALGINGFASDTKGFAHQGDLDAPLY
jgi:hypothetical protein